MEKMTANEMKNHYALGTAGLIGQAWPPVQRGEVQCRRCLAIYPFGTVHNPDACKRAPEVAPHTCHGNEHMPPGPCLACEVERKAPR